MVTYSHHVKKWGLSLNSPNGLSINELTRPPDGFPNDVQFVPWIFYAQKDAWFSHIGFLCATCIMGIADIIAEGKELKEIFDKEKL
jgi:hypothetical protein